MAANPNEAKLAGAPNLRAAANDALDKDTQEKSEVVKTRLITQYGYCEVCANDVLQYVASIFARGDVRK